MVELLQSFGAHGAKAGLTATSADGAVHRLACSELLDWVGRGAALLERHGLGQGQVVGIHLDNAAGLEALVLHWAAQWMGAVPVPLGTRLAKPEVDYIVGDAGAALVCSGLGNLGLASELGVPVLDCTGGLASLLSGLPVHAPARVSEHDLADILYTSGTTGRPKGVELTHANNAAAAHELRSATDLQADDVLQSGVPYFTSTGVHTNPLMCLAAGAHHVVEAAFDQHRVLQRAAIEGTTHYLGAPSMLGLILRDVDTATAPASLRQLVFGGSVMSAAALTRLAGAFPRCGLTNLYGQTEAGPNGTVCKPDAIHDKPGSIGNQGMGPWTAFGVVTDDGRAVRSAGDIGEIVLRSPSVMKGYRGDPDATGTALAGGWLHTGDLGYVDEDVFLFYADRSKDLIIRGGFNISSAEVESVLLSHEGVADAAVIGVEHEILGEDVVAVVVAVGGLDVDALLAHARSQLADYKTPRRVVLVDELPRNAMGKVLKRELRSVLGGR
jgi:acyl-CoA synthetase (AMP-forming)/AMP-acid ligase II